MSEVFKIQRPLATNGPEEVMIYNEDRSAGGQVPMTPELRQFFGGAYKLFVVGTILPDGRVQIEDLIPPTFWPEW